jgi:hypothetical protein
MSRIFVLAIVLLFGLGAAAPSQTLDVGNYRLSIQNNVLTARDRTSKRVAWQRPAPARAFRWLGSFEDVAVGVGLEPKRTGTGTQSNANDDSRPFKTVFALNVKSGTRVWRSQTLQIRDERVTGRVAIFSEPNITYAFSVSHVIDIATGKLVYVTKGGLEQFGDFLISACLDVPMPYCDSSLEVARLNLITLEVRGYRFEKPLLKDCEYVGDGDVEAVRFTFTHADFVLRVSCGYVFLRYRWDLPSGQIPVLRMLKEPQMPV